VYNILIDYKCPEQSKGTTRSINVYVHKKLDVKQAYFRNYDEISNSNHNCQRYTI